jgi:hypothetical protein
MSLALLLALQAAAPVQSDPAVRDFDLRDVGAPKGFESPVRPDAGCGADAADEIVVCGSRSRDETYRLRPLPPGYGEKPLTAETGLFGDVSARMHVESVQFPNGMISKRLMVTFTAPF